MTNGFGAFSRRRQIETMYEFLFVPQKRILAGTDRETHDLDGDDFHYGH